MTAKTLELLVQEEEYILDREEDEVLDKIENVVEEPKKEVINFDVLEKDVNDEPKPVGPIEEIENKLYKFIDTINNYHLLNVVDIQQNEKGEDVVCIYCKLDKGHHFEILASTIIETDWDNKNNLNNYIDIFLGKRENFIIDKISRVVGYFSKVSNWNSSKHAELRDRNKGNYSTGGGTFKPKVQSEVDLKITEDKPIHNVVL